MPAPPQVPQADHDHGHGHDHRHGHNHAHGHHHHHEHGPAHTPGHGHLPTRFGRAFAIGIALNIGFVALEAVFGIVANSMALLADAGHNLSDVLGLIVAWAAIRLSQRAPSARFTYGLGASSILAALINAALLLVAVGVIAWEALHRLLAPAPVAEELVMAVAGAGILVNGATALLFASGRKGDLNIRGAYLHMMADAATSAGVVAGGALTLITGWFWVDGAVGLMICGVIIIGTLGLLRDSAYLSLGAAPRGIDTRAVRDYLQSRDGVVALHDLHIWALGTTQTALSAHLVMPTATPDDTFLATITHDLRTRHGIAHVTLQIERDASTCPLAKGCAA